MPAPQRRRSHLHFKKKVEPLVYLPVKVEHPADYIEVSPDDALKTWILLKRISLDTEPVLAKVVFKIADLRLLNHISYAGIIAYLRENGIYSV